VRLSKTLITSVLRALIALTASLVWLSLFGIEGEPFGGCAVTGYTTFEFGCSTWPEFRDGFGFILICLVLGPKQKWFYALSAALLVTLAVHGAIRLTGSGLIELLGDWIWYQTDTIHRIVGGLAASAVYAGSKSIAERYLQDTNGRSS